MPDRASIDLDSQLFKRVSHLAEAAGCSSVEEFIIRILEQRVAGGPDPESRGADRRPAGEHEP